MSALQPVLLWTLAVALLLLGLAGLVFPVLPGIPLMFAGMLLAAWIDDFTRIGPWSLGVLGVLTLVTLVIDFAAGSLGAKRAGASPRAVTGAAVGTVVGIFFGLPGLILGPFVGAVVGELAGAGGPGRALRVGIASWLGFVFGTVLKVAIAFAMLGVFAFALLVD
jgi:uncharacterized protein YqgC (DUF456 family)